MAEPDNGPLAACHLRWGVQIPTLLGNGRPRVRRLPVECFQQRCQPDKVQAGGGSVHDWGAFHSGAKPPLVLLDRYLTGELYRGILWNTLVLFAIQHFGDNYRYQDDNAISHRARVVCEFKCGELALRTEEVWLYQKEDDWIEWRYSLKQCQNQTLSNPKHMQHIVIEFKIE